MSSDGSDFVEFKYATVDRGLDPLVALEGRREQADRQLGHFIFSTLLVICLVVVAIHTLDAVQRGNARRDRLAACKTIESPAQRASCIKGT